MATSVMIALDYFFGLAVFGFLYWLLNGIVPEFMAISETNAIYNLAVWLWHGSLVLYLVFGIFWLPRKLKEYDNWNGGRF